MFNVEPEKKSWLSKKEVAALYEKRARSYLSAFELLIQYLEALQENPYQYVLLGVHQQLVDELNKSPFLEEAPQERLNKLIGTILYFIKTSLNPQDSSEAKKCLGEAEILATWENKQNDTDLIEEEVSHRDLKVDATVRNVPMNTLSQGQQAEYQLIYDKRPPEWFSALPLWEQDYVKHKFPKGQEIQPRFIPTEERRLVGNPNTWSHELTVERLDDEKKEASPVSFMRFRHGASVPYKIKDKAERHRITKLNILQLVGTNDPKELRSELKNAFSPLVSQVTKLAIEGRLNPDPTVVTEVPVLLQTLLTPAVIDALFHRKDTNIIADLEEVIKKLQNNPPTITVMAKDGQDRDQEYRIKPRFILTDYKINIAETPVEKIQFAYADNKISAYMLIDMVDARLLKLVPKGSPDEKAQIEIITRFCLNAKTKINKEKSTIDVQNDGILLSEKYPDYKLLLNAVADYADIYAEEGSFGTLHHAAFEQIIAEQLGGIAAGSCLSGKDRKGTEIIYTDAVYIFYVRYGCLPLSFHEKLPSKPALRKQQQNDRKNFIQIFKNQFAAQYSQKIAGANAPGAQAFKNFNFYLPEDLKSELKKTWPHIFDFNKEISALNKLDAAYPAPDREKIETLCKKAARTNCAAVSCDADLKEKVGQMIISEQWERGTRIEEIQDPRVEVRCFNAGEHFTANTVIARGNLEAQMQTAAQWVVDYYLENSLKSDRDIIRLTGLKEVVTLNQLILLNLGVPPQQIAIPKGYQKIVPERTLDETIKKYAPKNKDIILQARERYNDLGAGAVSPNDDLDDDANLRPRF